MTYIPLQDLTDEQWAQAHKAFYSLELIREMGGAVPDRTLSLQEFYNWAHDEMEADKLHGWAIVDDEEYLGHVLLVRPQGEWEVGVAIVDKSLRGSGVGVRAGLYALRYAFEELEAEQVVAFANNPDSGVREMLLRMDFKPMFHFLYINHDAWEVRWSRRT